MANDNLEKSGDAASSYTLAGPTTPWSHRWSARSGSSALSCFACLSRIRSLQEASYPAEALGEAGAGCRVHHAGDVSRQFLPPLGTHWRRKMARRVPRGKWRAMHKAGIKALAGVYPFVASRGPRDILEQHPEWRIRQTDEIPQKDYLGCLISPLRRRAGGATHKRIKEYDIDGYQFDGWYQMCYCRCDGCRELYKKDTGRELPERLDNFNPDYLAYNVWRDQNSSTASCSCANRSRPPSRTLSSSTGITTTRRQSGELDARVARLRGGLDEQGVVGRI